MGRLKRILVLDRRKARTLISLVSLCFAALLSVNKHAGWPRKGDPPTPSSDWMKDMASERFDRTAYPTEIKIAIVFGTRPEAVKMAPVIQAVARSSTLSAILISTGQHKQMLEQVLRQFSLQDKIQHELALMKPNQQLAELTSSAVRALDGVLRSSKPDAVLVQGDTTTAFITSLAAFYLKIPVGHIEAGLRTRDIYSPFPEEVNRQCISVMATYHFAPTEHAAKNLYDEGRRTNVFTTGNTVVDALYAILKTEPSDRVIELSKVVKTVSTLRDVRLILLTAHRRENLGEPILNIFTSIEKLLQEYPDVVVIYPIHLNPMVKQLAEQHFGVDTFHSLVQSDHAPPTTTHLRRLLIVPPLDHADLLFMMKESFFVMTDSGGIQEEAVTLGKPVLVLRDTTERPEGVLAGAAKLVGHSAESIYTEAASLLKDPDSYRSMSGSKKTYGDGNAAGNIVRILETMLRTPPPKTLPVSSSFHNEHSTAPYENVVVVTVWKRKTITQVLKMISKQTTLMTKRTAIVVVQNGEHVDISDALHRWNGSEAWSGVPPHVYHVHSTVETGYYGRFLAPMFVQTTPHATFIVLDDDVLFGSRYFENMLRVVDEGFLATRNGRFLNEKFLEFDWRGHWKEGPVDTFDEDDEYDFGGHLWAGRMVWLQAAFRAPPPLLYNAEDFWISAVLQTTLGIGTKRVRCPRPENGGDLELCACSMKQAGKHEAPNLGSDKINERRSKRHDAMKTIAKHYDYVTLSSRRRSAVEDVKNRHEEIRMERFHADEETLEMFQQCLYWY